MFRTLSAWFLVLALALPATALAQQEKASVAKADAKATATVDLNTATAAELEALPGIGATMAQRIIDYREKNGPFKKIEDLMNVKGIGEKSFLKLKPRLTASAPDPKTD